MSTLVPDTLQGALILSVIDFFLSFVIISGIGLVLAAFPVLNHMAKLFNKAPAKEAHAAKPAARPQAAAAKPAQGPASTANAGHPDDIAAIAAAVFAVMDGTPHRIINIEPSPGRSAWVAEGRIAHHASHTPNR